MNKVILMGRLTKDPEVRYSNDGNAIAKYSLAVDRKGQNAGTDFINIVAFGKSGEFAEKYLHKGMKILVEGHITTGSYTNKDNQKVYTFDVAVDSQEFAERKEASVDNRASEVAQITDGFNFPVDIEEDLPFGKPTR